MEENKKEKKEKNRVLMLFGIFVSFLLIWCIYWMVSGFFALAFPQQIFVGGVAVPTTCADTDPYVCLRYADKLWDGNLDEFVNSGYLLDYAHHYGDINARDGNFHGVLYSDVISDTGSGHIDVLTTVFVDDLGVNNDLGVLGDFAVTGDSNVESLQATFFFGNGAGLTDVNFNSADMNATFVPYEPKIGAAKDVNFAGKNLLSVLSLKDSAGVSAIHVPFRFLYDAVGIISAAWNGRLLYDVGGVASFDWANRLFINSAGITIARWGASSAGLTLDANMNVNNQNIWGVRDLNAASITATYFGSGANLHDVNINYADLNKTYVPYIGATKDVNLGDKNFATVGTGAFGIGRFTTGLLDDSGILSVDPYDRVLYAPDGSPVLFWSVGQISLGGDLDIGGYVIWDGSYTSINPSARTLYSFDGTDIILNWATAGIADFGDSNLITSGMGTFGKVFSTGDMNVKRDLNVGRDLNVIGNLSVKEKFFSSDINATFVPYIGATKDVDLGAHEITANVFNSVYGELFYDAVNSWWAMTSGGTATGLSVSNLVTDAIYDPTAATEMLFSGTGVVLNDTFQAATLTDGTFSVNSGSITGAAGSNNMWTNDAGYITGIGTGATTYWDLLEPAIDSSTGGGGIRLGLGHSESGNVQFWFGDVASFGSASDKIMRWYKADGQQIFSGVAGDGSTRQPLWLSEQGTNVGIGKIDYDSSDPAYQLQVDGNFSSDSGYLYTDGSGNLTATSFNGGVSDTYDDGTDTVITFTGGSATTISTAYDERLMKNIAYLSNDINAKTQLSPVSFQWNEMGLKQFPDANKRMGTMAGYKAQDVNKFYPNCVVPKDMNLTGKMETYLQYNSNCLNVMMGLKVQEKELQLEKTRADLNALEVRVEKLEKAKP